MDLRDLRKNYERGALDEIEIYVMPELLGGGKPLFPSAGVRSSVHLISAAALDRGCVRLHYRIGTPAPTGSA